MSNPNAALVYEILGAYQEGDQDKLRSLMHPEAEVRGAPGLINAGTYYGYDGFQEWIRQWDEAWDEASYGLCEIVGRAIRFQVHATPDEALEAGRGPAAQGR
jgi:ketosteroid isomerase-like protein